MANHKEESKTNEGAIHVKKEELLKKSFLAILLILYWALYVCGCVIVVRSAVAINPILGLLAFIGLSILGVIIGMACAIGILTILE